MILISSKKLTVDGVDVYPDHDPEAKTQFWYLPGAIRLAERNNRKALSYLWYTDGDTDPDGAGFLNFEVNTAVDSSILDKIKSEIASKWGADPQKITLSTVTYHTGNVNFSALGPIAAKAADTLKTDASVLYQSKDQLVWNAGSSSLVGDNAAVCSVKFTKEGKLAAAMKQAILDGANTIAALYRLEFLAMRPSVRFKVTGTLTKTIDEFTASIGAQIPLEVLILDVGISAGWQRIMSNTKLEIVVTDFTGEKEQEGLKWAQRVLLDYVIKNFFEVQIGPNWKPLKDDPEADEAVGKAKDTEEAAGDEAESDGKEGKEKESAVKEVVKAATSVIPKVKVRASYTRGEQKNEISFLYSEDKAKSYPIMPQALVLEGLKDPKNYITQVNRSQDPFGLPYPVVVALPENADRTKVGLQTINVQARYGAGAPKNITVNAGTVTGQNPFPFQYDKSGSREVEYSVDFVFKPGDDWQSDKFQYSSAGRVETGLITAMAESVAEFLTLTIDMDPDFVWENADQAVVSLTSRKWSGEKRVVIRKGRESEQTLRIRSDVKFQDDPVQCKVEVKKGAKTLYSYGPEVVSDKHVTVHDRFEDHIPVYFAAGFTDDSVEVTLTYEDSEWEDQFTLEKNQKGKNKVERKVPVLKTFYPKDKLEVRYQVTSDSGESFQGTVKGGAIATIRSKA